MDNYITIKELSELWGISLRRIQKMCADGDIPGTVKFGNVWAIPSDVEKPPDRRIKSGKYMNWRNVNKNKE